MAKCINFVGWNVTFHSFVRRLVYILLLMMAVGTVACHRTPSEAERQLIDIDSLIASAPDSALTLLAALSPSPNPQPAGTSEPSETSETSGTFGNSEDSSPSKLEGVRGSVSESVGARDSSPSKLEGVRGSVSASDEASPVPMTASERAYHALLTAQAMYKAYIPATTDSVINVAWDYYGNLGMFASATDRQRRVRAMLYKGTTAEELGHPDSAMYWYKRTEDFAQDDDHFNKGYSLMRQAALYQSQHTTDSADLKRYKMALRHFAAMNDTNYQLVCLTEIGTLYRKMNLDSARYYINQALDKSRNFDDKFFYYTNLVVNAGFELSSGNFSSVIESCRYVLENGIDYNSPDECRLLLSSAYIHINMPDSASKALPINLFSLQPEDRVMYYDTKALMMQHNGDSLNYYKNCLNGNLLADSILIESLQGKVRTAESRYELSKSQLALSKQHAEKKLWINLSIALILLLIICYTYFKYRLIKRKSELQSAQNQLFILNDQLNSITYNEYELRHSFDLISREQYSLIVTLESEINSVKNNQKEQRHKLLAELQDKENELSQAKLSMKKMLASYEEFCAIITDQIELMSKIAEKSQVLNNNPQLFLEQVKKIVSDKDNQIWVKLRVLVEHLYPGIMSKILILHSNLTNRERLLIMLTLMDLEPNAIAGCMKWSNAAMVSRHQYNLKIKMGIDKSLKKYLESFK